MARSKIPSSDSPSLSNASAIDEKERARQIITQLNNNFNTLEILKLTVWKICPSFLAFQIFEDVDTTSSEEEKTINARPLQTVLPSPKRSTRVKQRATKKNTKAKKQPIKTEEITALSIKTHQDAVSIITQEILVHLSSSKKKKKIAAEKERAVKIKQEQALQVEATMEAKKKAIQDEEGKRRVEFERKQKEELDARRKAEDAKPINQQPLMDTQIIKVDVEDLSEPEVDHLVRRASSFLEEMKSASKAFTSTSSKTSSSPVSQGMNAVVVMRSILEQPLDSLISTAMDNEKKIQSLQKGYEEKITAKSKFQQEFEQTLKKYEDTKQEISRVRKELQRLENVKDLT
uniref:Uncharacterized protein n=1 Tax=Fagus sylvatica TaxID=28930 RepID=A0A2N9F5Q0_FAGSY